MPFSQTQYYHAPKITPDTAKDKSDRLICTSVLMNYCVTSQKRACWKKVILNSNILLSFWSSGSLTCVSGEKLEAEVTGKLCCIGDWFLHLHIGLTQCAIWKSTRFTLSPQRHSSSREFTSPVRQAQPISYCALPLCKNKSRAQWHLLNTLGVWECGQQSTKENWIA